MSFVTLGLSAELLHTVAEQGYTEPTPVQKQAIPFILQGRDVMARAQTGTGKTAGFTLPMLQRLSPHASTSTSPARHPVRALILVPTRELAMQVEEAVRIYGKYVGLKIAVVYGGVNINPQIAQLRAGVDILVATPGRLLDHVGQKTANLSKVEILVLDEADRMLDMGFIPDIRRIIGLLPPKRQNLLFSATFSDEIKKLANGLLHDPASIEVERRNAPAELVTHVVHPVDRERKRDLLVHLAKTHDLRQALVFTRTKHMASRLATQLERAGIAATAIHSDKTQSARTKALADFKAGTVTMLVATDIAARGLDIEELPHVINFELPHVAEDYVHRIGRTGRAGSEGDAISLVCTEERNQLAEIERLLKCELPKAIVAGFEPTGSASHERARTEHAHAPRQSRESASRQKREPTPRQVREPQQRRDQSASAQPPRERHGAAGRSRPAQPKMTAELAKFISEPYTSKEPAHPTPPAPTHPTAHPHRRHKSAPVAALLGGGKRDGR